MSTIIKIILLIISLVIGAGVAYLGTSLIGGIDQQMKILIAIVLSLFTFVSLYFMSKGQGG
ncbi:hypothetical protein KKF81_05840 [Candidatus Micrarchaeota archaeon]|nr:hypothetical protein [Candidatus Micrarchaeota archaeon]MBU1166451.1 hypothetical protein [Candidatus Micrarchaeota archaeon]MBU1886542.1 hypothetical protein [Candidatus Micrarchaeota archaeon]